MTGLTLNVETQKTPKAVDDNDQEVISCCGYKNRRMQQEVVVSKANATAYELIPTHCVPD